MELAVEVDIMAQLGVVDDATNVQLAERVLSDGREHGGSLVRGDEVSVGGYGQLVKQFEDGVTDVLITHHVHGLVGVGGT